MYLLHFLLTRFNILIFNKDKEGHKVRTAEWLEHRFGLFERYCLPSVTKQTCQDFTWIVLFDSCTPDRFKSRIGEFQAKCQQLVPVFVDPENGRFFARVFRDEVVKRIGSNCNADLNYSMVLTTYLDNDDAIDVHFVEELQRRALALEDRTFISYDEGYQLFTDHNYVMHIRYPRNHFVSVVEGGEPSTVKTIYGYGSHYYIDKIPGVKIERVAGHPMWCEVIHDKNIGNDAYFLCARMVKDESLLITAYGLEEPVRYGIGIYLFKFLPRYVKTFFRRVAYFFFGRHW